MFLVDPTRRGGFVADRQFGPYRLDRLLGRGGMGEVYLAYDQVQQRVVAIKLLLESLSANPEYRARFEREARIAAALREQHIIPIHRYGEIEDRLYIDMRLVEGEDLGKLIAREGNLPPRRAVGIAAQVASALDAAHQAGLVHRDVKPGNVLLADNGSGSVDSVYLADFGIAREVVSDNPLTVTGTQLGTPDYMAPECFLSSEIDHRADVYALGCVLYQMLTGQKPFPVEGYAAALYQHVHTDPPRPSTVGSGIPVAMDTVIRTSMARDPQARYRSAGELAAAADAALDSAGIARVEAAPRSVETPAGMGPSPVGQQSPRLRATTRYTPPDGRAPAYAPPQPFVPPKPLEAPRSRRAWLAGGVAVVAAAAVAAVVLLTTATPPPAVTGQADLTLESATSLTGGAFTPDFRTSKSTPKRAIGTSSLPPGVLDHTAVSGSTEGIYRGVKGSSACDRNGLTTFFRNAQPVGSTWIEAAAGDPTLSPDDDLKTVTPQTLPTYIAGLTPVLLRADTRVTEFTDTAGVASARQAVLQAGTAVLVDAMGLPRVRCAGGSPLASPDANAPTATTAGAPWSGYALSGAVTMAAAPSTLRAFGLADASGTTIFRRPVGSTGKQDVDQTPQNALVEGTYELRGPQTSCVKLTNCTTDKTLTMTVQLKDCTPTACTVAAPRKAFAGEFPLAAAGASWLGSGPTGNAKAHTCAGAVKPTTIALTLTPGDFAVDPSGVWTANSLSGTVRKHSDALRTCAASEAVWNVSGKRTAS
jgi:serine/threonine-protein kinase